MDKGGTGLRKKLIDRAKRKYENRYVNIVKLIYFYKERKNFSGYKKLPVDYKREIKKYWKKYHVNISLKEYEFYYEKNKELNPRYITKKIYHSLIEPKLNNIINSEFLSDKNYLDLILKNANLPKTVIRNINGELLNDNYELISIEEAIKLINKTKTELIIKPSIESGGGRNIEFINEDNKQKLIDRIKNDHNFIVQEVIKQNEELSKYNESSINTVRVLSLLHKGKVHILYMVLRVGQNGMRVDNASSGGIQIVIKNDGTFSNYIVNIQNKELNNSKLIKKFSGKKMPFYEKIVEEVKKLHSFISTCKLVGWDITIDELGNPVVVEINLEDIGMTEKSQCINGPLFGEFTDEILDEIFK